MQPTHNPILPPLADGQKAALLAALTDMRRLVIDLSTAVTTGLPLQSQLADAQQQVDRLQRLYDVYVRRQI